MALSEPTIGVYQQAHELFITENSTETVLEIHQSPEIHFLEFHGEAGRDGTDGRNGLSNYQLAVQNGFSGSLTAWLASLKGEPGEPGSGANVVTKTAESTVGGHRVVKSTSRNTVDYASNTHLADKHLILGVTTGSAGAGTEVEVRVFGEMVEPSWVWTPGAPVFCGEGAQLTQTAPTTGFLAVIGTAISNDTIFIRIGQPIQLGA